MENSPLVEDFVFKVTDESVEENPEEVFPDSIEDGSNYIYFPNQTPEMHAKVKKALNGPPLRLYLCENMPTYIFTGKRALGESAIGFIEPSRKMVYGLATPDISRWATTGMVADKNDNEAVQRFNAYINADDNGKEITHW